MKFTTTYSSIHDTILIRSKKAIAEYDLKDCLFHNDVWKDDGDFFKLRTDFIPQEKSVYNRPTEIWKVFKVVKAENNHFGALVQTLEYVGEEHIDWQTGDVLKEIG